MNCELLNSKKNESLINVLKKYFDFIILDGAPINGLSDSIILSTYVDKVLLVTSIDHTPKSELKNTIKALQTVNASIVGCVANNVDITHGGYYGKYYYYYSEDGSGHKKKVKRRHSHKSDSKVDIPKAKEKVDDVIIEEITEDKKQDSPKPILKNENKEKKESGGNG